MIVQELSHSHRLSPNSTGEQQHRQSVSSNLIAYHSAAHFKRKRDPADPFSSTLQPSHKRTRAVSEDLEERDDSPAGAGRGPSSSVDGVLRQRDDDECLSLVHNYRRSRLYRQDTLPSSNRSSFFFPDDGEEDEERRASPTPMSFHCIKRATNICEDSDDDSRFDDPPEVRWRTSSPQEPIEAERVCSSSLISSSPQPQSAYASSLSPASPDSNSRMWQQGRTAEDVKVRERRPEWLSAPSGSAFQAFPVPGRNIDWSVKSCFRRVTNTGFHRGNSKGAFQDLDPIGDRETEAKAS